MFNIFNKRVDSMIIRKKELKDCEAWIDVNIKSWNENLKGVVSDKLLKFIRDKRDSRIQNATDNFVSDDQHYVLEENGKVIGILKLKESEKRIRKMWRSPRPLFIY